MKGVTLFREIMLENYSFAGQIGKAVPYSGYCLNDQVDSGSVLDADNVYPEVVEYLKNSREFSGVGESRGVYDLSYRRERGCCQIAA